MATQLRKSILLMLAIGWLNSNVLAQQEVNVNPAKGLLTINIPIYTFNMIDFNVDLGYMYNGRGYRPNITSSSKDGWEFFGGGTVKRILHGLNDEMPVTGSLKGWLGGSSYAVPLSFTPYDNNDPNDCTDEGQNASWLSTYYNTSDYDPDEFIVQAPGLNFKMMIDNQGNFRAIPAQDIKIEFINNWVNEKYFVITNQKGVKYTFSTFGKVTRTSLSPNDEQLRIFRDQKNKYYTPLDYADVWNLTKIESNGAAGYVHLDYNYYTDRYKTLDEEVNVFLKDVNSDTAVSNSVYKVGFSSTTRMYLKSITSSLGPKVEIPLEEDRPVTFNIFNKVEPGKPADRTINIFRLDSYPYNPFPNAIRSVTEKFANGASRFLYAFNYYTPYYEEGSWNFPTITHAKKTDAWGYFNGSAGQSPVPKIYVYPAFKSTTGVYRPYPIPGYTGASYTLPGNDAAANEDYTAYGALSGITYPNGGSSSFEYECNSFMDQDVNEEVKGAGLRIKAINYFDGIHTDAIMRKEYSYKNDSDQTSGTINVLPAYAISMPFYWSIKSSVAKPYSMIVSSYGTDSLDYWNHLTSRLDYDAYRGESEVSYSQVTIKETGNGKIRQRYSTPSSFWDLSDKPMTYVAQICDANSSTFITKGYYQYPFAALGNSQQCNLLKEFVYNENGDLLKKTEYDYENYNPDPVKIYGIRMDLNMGLRLLSKYAIDVNNSLLKQSKQTIYDSSLSGNSLVTLTDYDNSAFDRKVRSIKTVNSDNTESKTSFMYAGDFAAVTLPETAANSAMEAVVLLNNANNKEVVLEKSSAIKPGGAGDFLTVGSESNIFGKNIVDGAPYPVLKETKIIKNMSGLSDFVAAHVSGSSPNKTLTLDSRYKQLKTYENFNEHNQATKVTEKRQYTNIINDTLFRVPALVLSGAERANVLFANFDKVDTVNHLIPQWTDTQYPTDPYFGRAVKLQLSEPMVHNFVRKVEDKFYKVGFLCKASAATEINLTVIHSTIIYPVGTIAVSASDEYKYYEKEIDLSAYTSGFFRIISDADVQLDNVIFYPSSAQFSFSNYANPFQKVAELNSSGQAKLYDYDKQERIIAERDLSKNITNAKFFSFSGTMSQKDYITPFFLDTVNNITGRKLKFKLVDIDMPPKDKSALLPGTKYEWDFGDGSSPVTTYDVYADHIYTTPGTYQVSIVVTHPDYLEHPEFYSPGGPSFITIQVRAANMQVEMGVSGITSWNPCYDIYNYSNVPGHPPGNIEAPDGTWFYAMPLGCTGGVKKYYWEVSYDGGVNYDPAYVENEYQSAFYLDKYEYWDEVYVRCRVVMEACEAERVSTPVLIMSGCDVF